MTDTDRQTDRKIILTDQLIIKRELHTSILYYYRIISTLAG